MITASKAFIAFCLLALVGTALVIGPTELRRLLPDGTKVTVAAKPEAKVEPKVEPKTEAKVEPKLEAKVEPKLESKPDTSKLEPESKPELKPEQPKLAGSAPPAAAAEPKAGALAETQKQVAALGDLVLVKPPAPAADAGPRFDVARVDEHGEAAVIAGRASPGARVELLRDGKPLDSVVADASGQFVMTPPPLPAGSYDLTLRAKAPDGTVTESGRTMPVTIAAAAPPPARTPPVAKQEAKPAEKPDDKSDVVAALPSASPRLASVPEKQAARSKLIGAPKPKAFAHAPAATAVASASPAEALTAAPAEAGGSRIIARGDSLWALSRLAYGDGSRYAVIFNANRDKIQNPNLIYPGQTFVMPQKAE
ncbi:LysM peptidoglycan-binding domain-containing protein [Bradyrhizobium sp. NBAIM20]|uniref:LysM peptidoglycan-binding domain-containing protein n=1 Tax=unclassified Bradyrhizobium TaxID=2631580 RepID=UPI001CD1DD6F|nr:MULTISPECIES: LysM peptidoglycan-binding domain-containing protein [unclassified Bradyrhizobium]MCA1415233.1 LysM peptidoglycan-binding domain-containing protein [Bradyrhizobium sp. NBAIM20]MCA1465334.1 LysM peptidoglycan-binding domain-containing protein [Bradyrhizobium sp. NBAIM18]